MIDKDIPSFYSTTQASLHLGLTDSAVRFYCKEFNLEIKREGSHRRFKEEDIEKLKLIKKLLKENKWSIEQVKIHLAETNSKSNEKRKDISPEHEAIISEILTEFNKKLESTKIDIIKNMNDSFKIINEETKKQHTETLNEFKKHVDLLRQHIKIEQEKNKQLTDLILKLYDKPTNGNNASKNIIPKKKEMKKSIFTMFDK